MKNVFIRRGALILTPASCIFLGGEVKNLHTTLNTSTTTITSSIQTTTTRPMLQPPPQAMTQALPSHAITNHQTVNPAQPNRSYQQQPSTMTTTITQNITQSSHLPLQSPYNLQLLLYFATRQAALITLLSNNQTLLRRTPTTQELPPPINFNNTILSLPLQTITQHPPLPQHNSWEKKKR